MSMLAMLSVWHRRRQHAGAPRRIRLVVVCLLAGLACRALAANVPPAADPWIGKMVIPIHRNVAMRDSSGASVAVTEVVLRVLEARDGQLLVRSLDRAGWIARQDAVLVDDAVGYFSEQIERNPADSDAFHRR